MNSNSIKKLAKRFRDSICKAKGNGEFNDDFMFCNFPRGCCGDAADLLGIFLMENGIKDVLYVCGNCYEGLDEGMQSHAWLQIADLIVDITGDQFRCDERYYYYDETVYVGPLDDFHKLFEVRPCMDIRQVVNINNCSEVCRGRLQKLYLIIMEYL